MNHKHYLLVLFIFLVAQFMGDTVVMAAPPAQGSYTIRGVVRDEGYQGINSVRVEVWQGNINVRTTYTRNDGVYEATGIAPGNYHLAFAKDGYRSVNIRWLTVTDGDVNGQDWRMNAQISAHKYGYISQTGGDKDVYHPGECFEASLTLVNRGIAKWYRDGMIGVDGFKHQEGSIRLGAYDADDPPDYQPTYSFHDHNRTDGQPKTWLSEVRVKLLPNTTSKTYVEPGERGTFNFSLCVPDSTAYRATLPKTERIRLRPVSEYLGWMDDIGGVIESGNGIVWEIKVVEEDVTPPTGRIVQPVNGSTLATGSHTIAAEVSDQGGSGIKTVEFYVEYDNRRRTIGSNHGIGPYGTRWTTPADLASQYLTFGLSVTNNTGNRAEGTESRVWFKANEPTPDRDDSVLVGGNSQDIHLKRPKNTVDITVELKNKGNITWGSDYALVNISNTDEQLVRATKTQLPIAANEPVAPNQTHQWVFTLTAPDGKAPIWEHNQHVSQWQLQKDGQAIGTPIDIKLNVLHYDVVSQSPTNGTVFKPNNQHEFTLQIKNFSPVAWCQTTTTDCFEVNLATGSEYGRTDHEKTQREASYFYSSRYKNGWQDAGKTVNLQQERVEPGQTATFKFQMTIPPLNTNGIGEGEHRQYMTPVIESIEWLQDRGIHWSFEVQNGGEDGDKKIILLQAGHWQIKDAPDGLKGFTGSTGGGYTEADITYAIAQKVKALLENTGKYRVEVLPAYWESTKTGDLFLSLHTDGNNDNSVTGFVADRYSASTNPDDDLLVETIVDYYGQAVNGVIEYGPGRKNPNTYNYYIFTGFRGVFATSPYLTNGFPKALLEMGFLSSPNDRQILVNDQNKVSQGVAQSIMAFFGKKSDTPPANDPPNCVPNLDYVADATILDGASKASGEHFVKTWTVKNSGSCKWTSGYQLKYLRGEQMDAVDSVPLPSLASNTTGDVSVEMVGPTKPNLHRGYWQAVDSAGNRFGDQIYVEIRVNPVTGNDIVQGRITNQETGARVANAQVYIAGNRADTATDGTYMFNNLPQATHNVYIEAIGYQAFRGSVTVEASQVTVFNAQLEPTNDDGYRLPYPGGTKYYVTQGNFGSYSHKGNWKYAYDFGMAVGADVAASRNGKVVSIKENSNYGGKGVSCSYANYVRIQHSDGTNTLYYHLNYKGVSPNLYDFVKSGQVIADSGNTGCSTGPHLDFTRHHNSNWANSIKTRFLDVPTNGGIPQYGGTYQSGNYLVGSRQSTKQLDNTSPTGSVQFQLTGAKPHKVWFNGFDYGSISLKMRIGETQEALNAARWQNFTSELDWSLPEIWVQYRDEVGNVSEVYSDTIDYIAYNDVQADFDVGSQSCAGNLVEIENLTTPFCHQCGWNWDFGNGGQSIVAHPSFPDTVYPQAGVYHITLDVAGAVNTSRVSKQLVVQESPSADFTMVRRGNVITVEAVTTDAEAWLWDFGDSYTTTGRIAVHTYEDNSLTNIVPITLQAEGANGCGSRSHQLVEQIAVNSNSLTIVNKTSPENISVLFGFEGDLGEFSLTANGLQRFTKLIAGEYNVTVDPTTFPDEFWQIISVKCQDQHGASIPAELNHDNFASIIPLAEDQHLTCTFLHERADYQGPNKVYLPLIIR